MQNQYHHHQAVNIQQNQTQKHKIYCRFFIHLLFVVIICVITVMYFHMRDSSLTVMMSQDVLQLGNQEVSQISFNNQFYLRKNTNKKHNHHLLSSTQHISVNRILQGETIQDTDTSIARWVLLIIIILFVVVPFVSLIIFGIVILYQRLRANRQNQQNAQGPVQVQVNITEYKIDQIGPYLSNPNDQCSICLDNVTNIRTFCGHFFHGQCLKAWYDKKTTDGRSPTCPICVGSQINPVKIYCKKCFVSGKLDVIYCQTSQQKIDQLSNFKCNQCRDQTIGSQTTQNIQKKKDFINHKKEQTNEQIPQSASKLYIETISI